MKNKFHSHFLAVALIAFIVHGLLGCSFTGAMNNSTPEPTIVNIPNNQKPTLILDQEGNDLATSAITLTPSLIAHDLRMRVSIIEELSTDEIIDFVWAPDGTSFAIAGRYNNRFGIALFTLNSEQPKWFAEYGPIFGLAFTSDGDNVVFSWAIGYLTFLNVETGLKVKEIIDESCAQTGYTAIVSYGKQIYGAYWFGGKNKPFMTRIDAWDIEGETCEPGVIEQNGMLSSFSINKNGYLALNLFRVGNENDFEVQIWNIQFKIQKCVIKGGKWSVLNPILNEVVVSEGDGKFIWDVTTCKVEKEIQISTDSGLSTYHPDGNILGTASQGISFLDLSNNSILNKIEDFPNFPNWPRIISFNPDGSLFAAVVSSKTDQEPDTVAIWKIEYEDN